MCSEINITFKNLLLYVFRIKVYVSMSPFTSGNTIKIILITASFGLVLSSLQQTVFLAASENIMLQWFMLKVNRNSSRGDDFTV